MATTISKKSISVGAVICALLLLLQKKIYEPE